MTKIFQKQLSLKIKESVKNWCFIENHKDFIENNKVTLKSQQTFQTEKRNFFTEETNKFIK